MAKTEKDIIERVDQLIRLQCTGNAKELGGKLNVCERTAYNILDRVKEKYNAPLSFNKYKNSYIYKRPGRIVLEFQSEIIELSDMKKIKGGKLLFLEKKHLLQNNCSVANYICTDKLNY